MPSSNQTKPIQVEGWDQESGHTTTDTDPLRMKPLDPRRAPTEIALCKHSGRFDFLSPSAGENGYAVDLSAHTKAIPNLQVRPSLS